MNLPAQIAPLIADGALSNAIDALERGADSRPESETATLRWEAERLRRLMRDFRLTEEEALAGIRELVPSATMEDVRRWADEGHLQTRTIDGVCRHFFKNPSNLVRVCEDARRLRVECGLPPRLVRQPRELPEEKRVDLESHLAGLRRHEGLCCPHRYRIAHTLTVKPGQVPEGEAILCWLPIPRPDSHQTDIEIIATNPEQHRLASEQAPQRTVHLEAPSRGDEPTVFRVVYEFTAWAHHLTLDPDAVETLDVDDPECQRFTREEPPHIVFTDRVRELTRQIVGELGNPLLRAQRLIGWIQDHIRWIGERDYSTITSFTDLALDRQAGDCGVQALLFITMARCAGIPARWESGWWVEPSTVNMHDWARFLIRPHGWLWADLTKGAESEAYGDSNPREFYQGHIDACRLVTNADCGKPFEPPMQHWRCDTVDSQRGEVEWRESSLNFDAWDWEFDVELLNR